MKKGLCHTRVHKKDFGGVLIPFAEFAEAAYAPEYFSFSKAKELVENKEHFAAAFCPFFCLESINGAEYPVLWYRTNIIGEVRPKEIILTPAYKEYQDRLRKYVPAGTKITLWKPKS